MKRKIEIENNLKKIQPKLKQSTLVAVTKYYPASDALLAYDLGLRHFGESKVQDLKEKSAFFLEKKLEPIWHFIGHLQTNKVSMLFKIPHLKYIHSVDSLKLLKEIYSKADLLLDNKVSFFLQVKTSDEEEKYGLNSSNELNECLHFIKENAHASLQFIGLMTIGKIRTDNFTQDAIQSFKNLRNYRDTVQTQFDFHDLKLSMGMSDDFEMAINEGSDFIRLGSILFN